MGKIVHTRLSVVFARRAVVFGNPLYDGSVC